MPHVFENDGKVWKTQEHIHVQEMWINSLP